MTTDTPRIGHLPPGPRNTLCDVPGVTVGHCTLADGPVQTGVTVIRPHAGDVYRDKVPAGVAVINGFGKSAGLVQVQELGVLETPIALTNTFAVGTVMDAQIRAAIAANPEIGRAWPTVNPLVFECNDGYLNDIQTPSVQACHYDAALADASDHMAQGAVGAGRGMSSFELKGGIGAASRIAALDEGYTVGALVLANFGRLSNLIVAGRPLGRRLTAQREGEDGTPPSPTRRGVGGEGSPELGSIILIIATNAPLDARQLRRVSLRAAAGLARTGSDYGHGSGDIALAFSTAYTVPHETERAMPAMAMLHETRLDPLFEAAAQACEQAIVNALWHAETVAGRDNHRRISIREAAPHWRQWLA